MAKNRRKSQRRALGLVSSLKFAEAAPLTCSVIDISETGARIQIANPEKVPEQFTLLLSNAGSVSRSCKVVWRTKSEIGVTFPHRKPDANPT
jgi:methyl-accepting chemotaxis protein